MAPSCANPLGIQPAGNALLQSHPTAASARRTGLGRLALLSDELLTFVFQSLDAVDLYRIERTSKAIYAFCRQDAFFKHALLGHSQGRLASWHGTWRDSLKAALFSDSPSPPPVQAQGIYSDVLYTPYLCAAFDPASLTNQTSFSETIPRVDARTLSTCADLPPAPCILTHAIDDWPAYADPNQQWTLPKLARRCPEQLFRAEAVLCTLDTYQTYATHCATEDSPVYLFESEFVEKGAAAGLGQDFKVPAVFDEDLFEVLGGQRPDYRWLIAGPARSGSTFHQDPNNTSAWNAVTSGSKLWITFPKHVNPPGVQVSADMGEVRTPDSVAEWFLHYYSSARAQYGPNAKDPAKRGLMQEGICRAGEVFCIPSGFWHCVINLEESVAVTQNYVSRRELAAVLHFLKTRPEQVSGFKLHRSDSDDCEDEETGEVVFERLCKALKKDHGDLLLEALKQVARKEVGSKKTSVWDQLEAGKSAQAEQSASSFSFGFDVEEGADD